MKTKLELFAEGLALIDSFCALNGMSNVDVRTVARKDWPHDACAYYREDYIAICVDKCADIGTTGMQWSYPGYVVDRTPYGVLAHEMGHRVDLASALMRHGPYFSDFSVRLRSITREEPITTYCPNDAEWFAEMFRLFLTNPDLLRELRPAVHQALTERWRPLVTDLWVQILQPAPMRTFQAASNKVAKVKRS